MIKQLCWIVGLMINFSSINFVVAKENEFLILDYVIMSDGDSLGDMRVKILRSPQAQLIVEHSHIKLSSWGEELELQSVKIETYNEDLKLTKADTKIHVAESAYWIRLEPHSTHNKSLWGSYTEIKSISQQEDKQFVELTQSALSTLIPEANEILGLTEALFEKQKKTPYGVQFPQDDYDVTSNRLPSFLQRKGSQSLKKIRILDTEEILITEYELKDMGFEILSIGNRKVKGHHWQFSAPQQKPVHLWIKEDPSALSYILRHSGENDDGSYDIILKK